MTNETLENKSVRTENVSASMTLIWYDHTSIPYLGTQEEFMTLKKDLELRFSGSAQIEPKGGGLIVIMINPILKPQSLEPQDVVKPIVEYIKNYAARFDD